MRDHCGPAGLHRRLLRWACASAVLATACTAAQAQGQAQAEPANNVTELPSLGSHWRAVNPYRGDAAAARAGGVAFHHNCARCHGVDAVASGQGGMPAPDLRRLARFCRRIGDPALRDACMNDDDDYFRVTVLKGKTVVGIQHMPGWKDQLTQETIWAIKTYIDARGDVRR